MRTRRQAKDDVGLQNKIRDIQLKKEALVKQVEQAQAQAAGKNGTQHDQNSDELRDLLNKLNEVEQEEASLSAEHGNLGQEPDAYDMDIDPAVPDFAQTRDETLPTNDGDPAVKVEDAEEAGEAPQAGGSIIPKSTGRANPPIQSTEPRARSDPVPAIQVDDDDDDGVLVDMQSLSISTDGVADAWFRQRGTQAIVRLGPKRYPKYVVRPGKGYSTANLQEVSDAESRITSIKTKDRTGKYQRLYGKDYIAGYDGVAIVGNGVVTSSSRAPTTYIKVKWEGIREEHAHLCRNGKNWTTKTDLEEIIGEDIAYKVIRRLWDVQEKCHAEWEDSQMGRRSVDRSPTPCPHDVYQEVRGVRAPEVYRGSTVKREEGPLFMPGPYRKEGIPLASGVQPSSNSPPPAAGSLTLGAAEAAEANGSAAHSHGQDSSGNLDADEQKPKTFSERQYLENMKQDLGLESLRNEDLGQYMEQMALARAKFDVYRGEMERRGYVLVH
ncbi:hypothetical protein CBS76997_10744 [Aspergillus niger]|nr:hypothetical protein CBS76997_10744 [Aspergillus niger]